MLPQSTNERGMPIGIINSHFNLQISESWTCDSNLHPPQPYHFVPTALPDGSGSDEHRDPVYCIGDFVSGNCIAGEEDSFLDFI